MARMAVHNRAWGETNDYQRHTELLTRFACKEDKAARTKTREDRLVGVCTTIPCTVCPDETTPQKIVWHSNIPGTRLWWPTGQEDRMLRDDTGRVTEFLDEKICSRKHVSMTSALLSHLHRPDFNQVACTRHKDAPHAYTVRLKVGKNSCLPRLLEFDNGDAGISIAGTSMYIPAPGTTFACGNSLVESLQVTSGPQGVTYTCVAITYYNEAHYTASVLLNDTWYRYNNLGFHDGPDKPRTTNHLMHCASFREAATPSKGFHHRSYIYSRIDTTDRRNTRRQLRDDVDWTLYDHPTFGSLAMLAGSEDDEAGHEPDGDRILVGESSEEL
jgi:hypothetical protein